jgi:hypothetical protein
MNKEAVRMFATPAECILKDFVEFGDAGWADHEHSPPHQRTHAAEHYAKLIDRNGRYRRFGHANSLSKRKPTVSNLMPPGISRSPNSAISGNGELFQIEHYHSRYGVDMLMAPSP